MRFLEFLVPLIFLANCATTQTGLAGDPLILEPAALAPSIPGADEPAFQGALQTWLDGKDLAALKALAALARLDNRAAQIFLARVAEDADLHAHATSDLLRRERIALLRRPGGLSGRSWLDVAATDVPLASAFRDSSRIHARTQGVRALFSFGENMAASRSLMAMLLNGQASEVVDILAEAENPPPAALVLRIIARNMELSGRPRYTGSALPPPGWGPGWGWGNFIANEGVAVSDFLTWVPTSPRALFTDPDAQALAIEHSMNVPAWAPLRTMCERHCPSSVASCTAVGASMLWSTSVFPFASPAESLLPNARYWSSPRMELDIVRRLRDLRGNPNFFTGIDPCFAPTVGRLQRKAL